MTDDLFASGPDGCPVTVYPQTVLLPGMAAPVAKQLLHHINLISTLAPFRQMITPGGRKMSVHTTGCGQYSWISDRKGYRYTSHDPQSGLTWPSMPDVFFSLAENAANQAGFPDFSPDACLINRYTPGTRMSLHQDKDENNMAAPIVSVSLGISAIFIIGGLSRSSPVIKTELNHGDVIVWGGDDRMRYHGILPVPDTSHYETGRLRYNLTFRQYL